MTDQATPAVPTTRRKHLIDASLLLLAVAAVALAYWPSLYNGFVWDDILYLYDVELSDASLWTEALQAPFLLSPNYYRPLPLLSFIGQLHLHGPYPFGFHLANLLIHAINTLLVGWLALQLIRRTTDSGKLGWLAPVAALIYGLHPAQIEGVAWVSGRFDLLVTTFLLLALLADAGIRSHWLRAFAVGLCYFGAAASKEMAVAFPFILFAWHMARDPRPLLPLRELLRSTVRNGNVFVYAAVVAGGIAYIVWRYLAIGHIYVPAGDTTQALESELVTLLLFAKSLGWYLVATVYPFALISPVHPRPLEFPVTEPWAWLALSAIPLLVYGLTLLARHFPRFAWLWAAYLMAFLPVVHLLPMTIAENYVHDRFMMLPLALFAIALAASLAGAWARPHRHAKATRLGSILVLATFCLLSVINLKVTLPLWKSNLTLWSWAADRHPDSVTALANLADEYFRRQQYEKALEYAIQATRVSPTHVSTWSIAGNALTRLGRADEALTFHEMALNINPNPHADLINNACVSLIALKRYEDAEALLMRALALKPYSRRVNATLARLYVETRQDRKAAKHYEVTLRNLPADAQAVFWDQQKQGANPRTIERIQKQVAELQATNAAP